MVDHLLSSGRSGLSSPTSGFPRSTCSPGSFDRVIPTKFADVSPQFHTAWIAVHRDRRHRDSRRVPLLLPRLFVLLYDGNGPLGDLLHDARTGPDGVPLRQEGPLRTGPRLDWQEDRRHPDRLADRSSPRRSASRYVGIHRLLQLMRSPRSTPTAWSSLWSA